MTTTANTEVTSPDDTTPPPATATEGATTAVNGSTTPSGDTTAEETTDTDAEQGSKANREAARYRRQLRDAEAERDQLTGTVETLRRQVIAHNMPAGSSVSADLLWSLGHQAADFFTDDGAINAASLETVARETATRYGIKGRPDPVPGSGTSNGDPTAGMPSWADALQHRG